MKTIINTAFILVFLITLFSGCTKIDVVPETGAKAIVQGYLVAGRTIKVRVTKEILYESASTDSLIDTLKLYVTVDSTTYTLPYDSNGYYKSDTSILVQAGHTYNLAFAYNNLIITSSTIIPQKPTNFTESATQIKLSQITSGAFGGGNFTTDDNITLTWDNLSNDYYMVVAQNTESYPVLVDTRNLTRPNFVFKNEPQIADTYVIRPQSFEYFGNYDLVLLRLNLEYALLYNNTGTSSQNLTTPPTNIKNGLGIFTGINTDTLHLDIIKK